MNEIYLLGVGRNTPVFIDLAEHCGYNILGLYHYNQDRTGDSIHGFTILGSFDALYKQGSLSDGNFLLTMGNNVIRSSVAERIRAMGGNTPTLIHPSAIISRFSLIGTGVSISAFSYVQANSSVGNDTIILSGVNISHNNTIGKSCFIAGGATIGAYTDVGDFAFIGQGALTISDKVKHIGEYACIGAGALVTKSVPPRVTVAGQPAKPLPPKQR